MRVAVAGQLCFPPIIHEFKTGAAGKQDVAAERASIRGRVVCTAIPPCAALFTFDASQKYHNVCLKHDEIIKTKKLQLKAEGLTQARLLHVFSY